MIRLDRIDRDEQALLEICIEGRLILSAQNDDDVIATLHELGVDDPAPLVAGARQWGTVEIYHSAVQVRR